MPTSPKSDTHRLYRTRAGTKAVPESNSRRIEVYGQADTHISFSEGIASHATAIACVTGNGKGQQEQEEPRVGPVCGHENSLVQSKQQIVPHLVSLSPCAAHPDLKQILAGRTANAGVRHSPVKWQEAHQISATEMYSRDDTFSKHGS